MFLSCLSSARRDPQHVAPKSVWVGLRAASLVSIAVVMAGCAVQPTSKTGEGPKALSSYEYADSIKAQADANWPVRRWWQDARDPQLISLIDEALQTAPDMRMASARVLAAEGAVSGTRAALLPQVQAEAGVALAQTSESLGLPLPRGWDDNGKATINLGWELDFWGRNRAALSASLSELGAAKAEQAAAGLAISAAIADEYANLASLFASHDAASNAVRVRSRTVDLISERRSLGLEHDGAVERAKSAHSAAHADLEAVNEALLLTRHRIAALMGKGPDRGLLITRPAASIFPTVGIPENLPAELLGRRPDIVAARLRAEASAKRIKVAERSFYPNVNLGAFAGLQSLNLINFAKAESFIGSVGPAISLPIFAGGRLRADYRASEAGYEVAVAEYDKAVSQALNEVADALASQKALQLRLNHSREAVRAAEAAWQVAENRYRGGLATYLDVLSAEDQLINQRRLLATLETRALTLDVALIRALGGGYGA